jgi:hypothetical protein
LHRAAREGGQAIVGNVTQGTPATAPQKPTNVTPALADARKHAMTIIVIIAPQRDAASDSCRAGGLLIVSAVESDQRGRLQRWRDGRQLFVRDVRGGACSRHGDVCALSLCAAATYISAAMMPRPLSPRLQFGKLIVMIVFMLLYNFCGSGRRQQTIKITPFPSPRLLCKSVGHSVGTTLVHGPTHHHV